MGDVKWSDGLAEAIDILKPVMSGTFSATQEARSRLWKARDEVERLQRQLNDAQVALEAAERDYEDCGKHMMLVWEDFKAQIMKIPVSPHGGESDG